MGTSPVIIHNESAAGVQEGGRTGAPRGAGVRVFVAARICSRCRVNHAMTILTFSGVSIILSCVWEHFPTRHWPTDSNDIPGRLFPAGSAHYRLRRFARRGIGHLPSPPLSSLHLPTSEQESRSVARVGPECCTALLIRRSRCGSSPWIGGNLGHHQPKSGRSQLLPVDLGEESASSGRLRSQLIGARLHSSACSGKFLHGQTRPK